MRRIHNKHMIDFLFALGLFCVLAASALTVVLIGAGVYKDIVARSEDNFREGTTLTYISNKIRQNDELGAVYLDEVEGVPALVLERAYNDATYKTWIYHDDGALKEVMRRGEDAVRLSEGQRITEVSRLTMDELTEGLWRFTSYDGEDGQISLIVGIRSQAADADNTVTIA